MTPAQVIALINAEINDNTPGAITGTILNNILVQMVTLQTQVNPSLVPLRKITAGSVDNALKTDGIILWQSSSGLAKSEYLPAANTLASGQSITVVENYGDGGINNITIYANGTDKINGISTYLMNAVRQAVTFTSDGISAWVVN